MLNLDFSPNATDYSLRRRAMISHISVPEKRRLGTQPQSGHDEISFCFQKLMNPHLVSLRNHWSDCWRQSACDVSTGYHHLLLFSLAGLIRLGDRRKEFFDISIISFRLVLVENRLEKQLFIWKTSVADQRVSSSREFSIAAIHLEHFTTQTRPCFPLK